MKLQRVMGWAAPICAVALLATGCDRNRNEGTPGTLTEQSTGQRMDDKQVTSKIKDALDVNAAYKFPNGT